MDSTSIFMVIMVATGIVAAGVIALLAAGILKNRLTRSDRFWLMRPL